MAEFLHCVFRCSSRYLLFCVIAQIFFVSMNTNVHANLLCTMCIFYFRSLVCRSVEILYMTFVCVDGLSTGTCRYSGKLSETCEVGVLCLSGLVIPCAPAMARLCVMCVCVCLHRFSHELIGDQMFSLAI